MTKTILFSVFMAFTTMILANGLPTHGEATIDASKSIINWVGKKVTGKHEGTINVKSGTLKFDHDGLLIGGEISIDMTSIVCTDMSGGGAKKLEGHLSSDDFFGVEKFPVATIAISGSSKNADGSYAVKGDVTIKGVTHPVSFDAQINEDNATATISIDRTKYGIKYGSGSFFDNLGDKTINDEFTLDVSLAF